MNKKFEEWKSTTFFSKKPFFDSYIKYLKSLELFNKPMERISFFRLEKMRSTPLMSRLNYACQNKDQCIDSLIISIGCVDIVVIHGLPHKYGFISRQGGSWTMTELKRDGYWAFQEMDKERTVRKIHWDEQNWLNV